MPPDQQPPDVAGARVVASAEVSHVIIRACSDCGGPRQPDAPCAGCGNRKPPRVDDLGVLSATYRNPLRRAWWSLVRRPLASLRVRRVNRRHARDAAARSQTQRGGLR